MVFTVFGRGQRLDVQNVGGLRIFGSGAGPQQPLRIVAGLHDRLPARRGQQIAVGFVDASGNGNAQLVAQMRRAPSSHGNVPAADEHRRHRADIGRQTGGDAALDAAQVRFGSGEVLLAREQQRHIDRTRRRRWLLRSRADLPCVPGILMNRLGRAARACRSLAAASVLAVS